MKKFIFALLALAMTLPVMAQERVNREKLKFTAQGEKVRKIPAWGYDDTVGEWLKSYSVIERDKQNHKMGILPVSMAFEFNNIISLQAKSLTYNNTPYHVIVWEKFVGAYKYPNIKQDWEYWKTKIFLMFSPSDIAELNNLNNEPKHITILAPIKAREDVMVKDVDVIQSGMAKKYCPKVTMSIYKAADGNIRFLFSALGASDLEKQYFEMPETEFQKLLTVEEK
jgi:hypothetical protein